MQVRIIEESVISHDITLVGNTIKTELANVKMVLTAGWYKQWTQGPTGTRFHNTLLRGCIAYITISFHT